MRPRRGSTRYPDLTTMQIKTESNPTETYETCREVRREDCDENF